MLDKADLRSHALLPIPAAAVIVIFLLLPVGYLLALGVFSDEGTVDVRAYGQLLSSEFYLSVIARTAGYSLATLALCLIGGFSIALFIWRAPSRWRNILLLAAISPLLISVVARTYGWVVVLGDRGILNSLLKAIGATDEPIRIMYSHGAVIIGLVHVLLPFMILSVLAALERINPALLQAAETLGASPRATILRIVLPLAVPGMAAGATIVFGLSMSAYVTPLLMGGSNARMMANMIYQQFIITHNWSLGAALAGVLFVLSIATVFLVVRLFAVYTRRWQHVNE